MDQSTNGDVCDGKRVAGLDVGICAGVNDVAVLQSNGSDDIALCAFLILKQCNVCAAVGVVLDTDNGCGRLALTLEIDDSVLDLVSAATMTDGDATVAVTACVLLLGNNEALLGGELGDLLEGRNAHLASCRGSRLILNCWHFSKPPTLTSYHRRTRWSWSQPRG